MVNIVSKPESDVGIDPEGVVLNTGSEVVEGGNPHGDDGVSSVEVLNGGHELSKLLVIGGLLVPDVVLPVKYGGPSVGLDLIDDLVDGGLRELGLDRFGIVVSDCLFLVGGGEVHVSAKIANDHASEFKEHAVIGREDVCHHREVRNEIVEPGVVRIVVLGEGVPTADELLDEDAVDLVADLFPDDVVKVQRVFGHLFEEFAAVKVNL